MSKVLVTGGTGFVGSHTIRELLARGNEVTTTVRSLQREPTLRALVGKAGAAERLSIVEADLLRDDGWSVAALGCDYVLHVASPFPASSPKNEDELIGPARDGTLRVLRAARDARVKRVVVTSSFAAIGYGHAQQDRAFTEEDWTVADAQEVPPYMRSKALAERAAWDFIEREGGALELSVVNPVGIFGPVLGADFSSSIAIVKNMLDGAMPACPRVYFGVVDVRDVVDLHLRAMLSPAAKGERFLAVAGEPVSMLDLAKVLRAHLGESAARVPKEELPDAVVRAMAVENPKLREVVSQLGCIRRSSNEKAKRILDWSPRSNEEAIVATGESLVRLQSEKSSGLP